MHTSIDVSIVITNQNQGAWLERSIRSCLAQTFPGRIHQILVVDAASRDFSREIIQGYGKQIVPILLSDAGLSIEEAMAAGMKRANGRYLLHVRAQDFISDYMILFQAVWLYQNVAHDGVSVDYWLVEPGSDSKVKRLSGLASPCPYGTMYRKEVLLKEGLYGPHPRGWSPPMLQKRLAETHQIGHLAIPFYRYQRDEAVVAAADHARAEPGQGA